MFAIETTGLTKRFGKRVAVDDLDLRVPLGGITGFLGPNGAGKTTTIRMLLGLARPSRGSFRLLGQEAKDVRRAGNLVACLLEPPGILPTLKVATNISTLTAFSGTRPTPSRISEVLETVGLGDRALDRAGTLSHGQRQRMGLALALVNDPTLIIMDEPTTGLDPQGMREMRDLLARLKDGGKTIFLSSHLLGEVERVCDSLCILDKGRVRYQGTMEALRSSQDHVVVETDPPERAGAVLAEAGIICEPLGNGFKVLHDSQSDVLQILITAGAEIVSIRQAVGLEDMFFDLVQESGDHHRA